MPRSRLLFEGEQSGDLKKGFVPLAVFGAKQKKPRRSQTDRRSFSASETFFVQYLSSRAKYSSIIPFNASIPFVASLLA